MTWEKFKALVDEKLIEMEIPPETNMCYIDVSWSAFDKQDINVYYDNAGISIQ